MVRDGVTPDGCVKSGSRDSGTASNDDERSGDVGGDAGSVS